MAFTAIALLLSAVPVFADQPAPAPEAREFVDPVVLSARADALREAKRLDYDSEGRLAANQMGIFKYMKDSLDGGFVKLNERMTILTALVGEAFTYATVVHEAQHARDRAAGRLSPEREI